METIFSLTVCMLVFGVVGSVLGILEYVCLKLSGR